MTLTDRELQDFREAVRYAIDELITKLAVHHAFYSQSQLRDEYERVDRWKDLLRQSVIPS